MECKIRIWNIVSRINCDSVKVSSFTIQIPCVISQLKKKITTNPNHQIFVCILPENRCFLIVTIKVFVFGLSASATYHDKFLLEKINSLNIYCGHLYILCVYFFGMELKRFAHSHYLSNISIPYKWKISTEVQSIFFRF